ncbi:DHS-like NAD/FAD-binding domain-containing protein, partial [Fistulina hepatica ATCC 64428]
PPFVEEIPEEEHDFCMSKVVNSILSAKRIVVVCGAGISVEAGIPDFRSSEGLFHTLKRDSLSSGKDLFDASVFNSEETVMMFCQMIDELTRLSRTAAPTAFHRLLRTLDEQGRLLRVYTQNIDAIEQRTGMTYGVPAESDRKSKARAPPSCDPTRQLTCPAETPRCIPLHGTLQSMYCPICNHLCPLDDYLPLFPGGLPDCPDCAAGEEARQREGKRPRVTGRLRPGIVLYNEEHREGEDVGGVVHKDLVGTSKNRGRDAADLLLVVGTSLKVPGTKRIVREFAKAVGSRRSASEKPASTSSQCGTSSCILPGFCGSRSVDLQKPLKSIYLNLDFPVPSREWRDVFDVWIQDDAQNFA